MKLEQLKEARYAGRSDDPLLDWGERMHTALEDDLYQAWDGDVDAWLEIVDDNPSGTVETLWGEVPEDQEARYASAYEQIINQFKHENR